MKQDQASELFKWIIFNYDFIVLVMYQEMSKRRDFVQECWKMASLCGNTDLMLAISKDAQFFVTYSDILSLCILNETNIISQLLNNKTQL